MNVTTQGKRRASTKGCHQLNLLVTSTAWKKLQCYSAFIRYTKKRIVQALIVNYKFADEPIQVYCPSRLEEEVPSITHQPFDESAGMLAGDESF